MQREEEVVVAEVALLLVLVLQACREVLPSVMAFLEVLLVHLFECACV